MRPVIPCLFALLITSPAAAQVAGSVQQPIINGEPVDSDVFPSAAQLIIGGSLQGQQIKSPVCTATLVAPDVVLTAAHCLEDFPLTFGIFPLDDMTFWVTFEDDIHGIQTRHDIGVDNLVWGNDYPHRDSTWPCSRGVVDSIMADVSDADRSAMTSTTAAGLYGL